MMTNRTTARVVGGLFIAADVVGVLSLVFQQPDLTRASLNANSVATGALLLLMEAMAVVGIAVAVYSVLKRFRERLALAYVAIRTMEGMLSVIAAIGALTLLTVTQKYVNASTPDASLQTLGSALLSQRDWVNYAVLPIVFGLDALILNYVLYRGGLVPRWLSVWGLGGAALWLATGVAVTYGLRYTPALAAPIGLQEVALALWLIFKGFNAAAFASQPEEEPAAGRPEPRQHQT